MASTTFNVRFIIKPEKTDKQGLAPIYVRIRINGQKLELTCNHKILPTEWLLDQGIAKPGSKSNASINEFLESFRSRIYQAYSRVTLSGQEINVPNLKDAIVGKKEEVQIHFLVQTTIEHNLNFSKLVGIKYSEGSFKNYRTSLKYYQEFVPTFFKKKDIPLSQSDKGFGYC